MELFDRYIDGELSGEEKREFEEKLKTDREMARDFRIYLFTLDGVCREAEQEDIDFGMAMKNIGSDDFLRAIGRGKKVNPLPSTPAEDLGITDIPAEGVENRWRSRIRSLRIGWSVSIAAMFVVGLFSLYDVWQSGRNRVDDLIVAYNYIPDFDRGEADRKAYSTSGEKDMIALEKAYREAPDDDIQAQEDAGMRLAMAYLEKHDRGKAREILGEMQERFADDASFTARCRKILGQLK